MQLVRARCARRLTDDPDTGGPSPGSPRGKTGGRRMLASRGNALITGAAAVSACALIYAVRRRCRPLSQRELLHSVAHLLPPPHFSVAGCGVPGSHAEHERSADPSGRLRPEDKVAYQRDGYLVVRGLLSPHEVARVKEEMLAIIEAWPMSGEGVPGDAPETPLVSFDPSVISGEVVPKTKAHGVRRLFRLAVHNSFFRQLCGDERLVGFLRSLWGEDVALIQSMALMKPPKTGEKRWHQDQGRRPRPSFRPRAPLVAVSQVVTSGAPPVAGYFRLLPSQVAAYWIAIDETDVGNGCMHVVPGSHRAGLQLHGKGALPDVPGLNLGGIFYSAVSAPAPTDNIRAVPMAPGDALLFHGDLLHATPPNTSADRPRCAVQLHYAAGRCRPCACGDAPGALRAPNTVYPGANGVARKVAAAFDCAPEASGGGEPCVEPQYWYYRRGEMTVSGRQLGPGYV